MTDSMTVLEALDVLQLAPGAPPTEVSAAYRQAITTCHPDLATGESDAAERAAKATRVNLAHALLTKYGTGPASRPSYAANDWGDAQEAVTEPTRATQGVQRPRAASSPVHPRSAAPGPPQRVSRTAPATSKKRVWPRWTVTAATVFVAVGALLRLLHFWSGLLADSPWGSADAQKSVAAVLVAAALGVGGVWLLSKLRPGVAVATLVVAVVLYSSFAEVHIRLNWAETSLLFGSLVLTPLYFLVVVPVRCRMAELDAPEQPQGN